MLKPTLIAACLAAAASLGGCAAHPPGQEIVAARDPDCVRYTGTRIERPDRRCVDAPGSSYTQQDLERTGEIDLGAALRRMDPRFQ